MNQELALIDRSLKTPRAAAIAGIIFSILLTIGLLMMRSSIPANPLGAAAEVVHHAAMPWRAGQCFAPIAATTRLPDNAPWPEDRQEWVSRNETGGTPLGTRLSIHIWGCTFCLS